MRILSSLFGALGLGAMMWFGAAPAAAYPDVQCHISDPGRACEGSPLTLTATVTPAVNCTSLSITWNGITRSGTGASLQATFPTEVGDADDPTITSDVASCTFEDESGATQTVSSRGTVIISACGDSDDSDSSDDSDGSDNSDDSDDSDDDGGLPNTGGERLLWLILGIVLLVAGGVLATIESDDEEEGRLQTP